MGARWIGHALVTLVAVVMRRVSDDTDRNRRYAPNGAILTCSLPHR